MKFKNNKWVLICLGIFLAITIAGWNVASAESAPPVNAKPASIIGYGTIEAINLDKHQLTIKHEAIKAIEWPAMTMTFTVPKLDISQWKVGDNIKFYLDKDKTNQITQIEKSDK